MEELLLSLINLIGENLTTIRWVDEDYGQLDAYNEESRDEYPLTFPCVLVDAPSTAWDDIARGSQHGACTVTVKLAIDCYDDTQYSNPEDSRNKITERATMLKTLHTLLQNKSLDGSSSLCRKTSRFYTIPGNGIKVYEASYQCDVTDILDDNKQIVTDVKPKLQLGIIRAAQQ